MKLVTNVERNLTKKESFTQSRFKYLKSTIISWPVMITEIIQRLTLVPAVPGSILGWSSVMCFYFIALRTHFPTVVAIYNLFVQLSFDNML